MKVTIYDMKLNHAQNALVDSFENVEVTMGIKPYIIVKVKTFALQTIQLTVNQNGIIEHVELLES
jgi:hypothetical protein